MKLTGKIVFTVWSLISILLVGLYIASLGIQIGTVFFLLLNALNAILILFAFLFRKKIEIAAKSLIAIYESILKQTSKTRIIVEYSHESGYGRFFIATVSVFGVYVAILSLWDTQAYGLLIGEDAIIEYASFIFWFLAAPILFYSFTRSKLRHQVYSLQILPYLLLTTFFIVCAGEEISWGQRILNFETPEFLKTINVQDELTLHNIGSISIFSNAFFLLTIIFFLLVPYIRSKNPKLKQLIDYFGLPTPNRYAVIVYIISLAIWIFIGVRFGTLGFHPFSFYAENYYTQMDDEVFEFLAAYSFFCFSVMDSLKETRLERNP